MGLNAKWQKRELDEVESDVVEFICEHSGIGERDVRLESHTKNDLGLDSMDMLEVIMSIEEKYSMDFTGDQDEKIYTGGTVKEIADVTKERLGRK